MICEFCQKNKTSKCYECHLLHAANFAGISIELLKKIFKKIDYNIKLSKDDNEKPS